MADPTPPPPPTTTTKPPRPKRWRRTGRALLLVAFPVAAFYGTLFFWPEVNPPPVWSASNNATPPNDFLYAMFPVNNSVDLFDAPDGNRVGTLRRAVVNSQEEIDAGGWVRVNDAAGPRWVRMSDLGFTPPPDANTDYFAAFDTSYRERTGDMFSSASIDLDTTSAGTTTAKLRLRPDDDHVQEYVYHASPTPAKPLEMYRYFAPGEAMKAVGPAVLAGTAAASIVGVVGIAAEVRYRRMRRRVVQAPQLAK